MYIDTALLYLLICNAPVSVVVKEKVLYICESVFRGSSTKLIDNQNITTTMKKQLTCFSRLLCAAILSFGLVLTSCEDGFLGDGENTEQGENDNGESDGTASGGVGETNDAITNASGGVTLTVMLRNLTETGVAFYGEAVLAENYTASSFGILYSEEEIFTAANAQCLQIVDIYGTNYSVSTSSLKPSTTYYYTSYIKQGDLYKYGEIKSFTTLGYPYNVQTDLNLSSATNLSSSASANCYIVSKAGLYKFKTVKGNSTESVGNIASASILWETFGTSETPDYCELIKAFCYNDGYIAFLIADTFKEGNAVVAAKDANGNILWSWHIWLTDQPHGQVYYNKAGSLMDRNLGATSATPGDVGALGLFYQWGRKDPFLGSSSISSCTLAKSTITWPSAVSSDSSNGTIAYATANPTTFITYNDSNYDWYYTGSSSTDNTRWTTSESNKSVYDPCPAGWRVPDGGSNGVWSMSLGASDTIWDYPYDSTNEGMHFSGKFGANQTIWYPASGWRSRSDGSLRNVGSYGSYWSASPYGSYRAYSLFFANDASNPSSSDNRAYGLSVRCLQE